MKLKSYLRGLGLGMIVTTIILVIAFSSRRHNMTDEEIMAKARELGMVETSAFGNGDKKDDNTGNQESTNATTAKNEGSISIEVTPDSSENKGETSGEGQISTENTTLNSQEETTAKEPETTKKPETTTKATEAETPKKPEATTKATEAPTKATEAPTKATEPETTKKPEATTEATQPTKPAVTEAANKTVTLIFEDIRSADMASNILYDAGIIQDVDSFNDYLTEKGWATKVGEGEFEFRKGMTFDEIARIITHQR